MTEPKQYHSFTVIRHRGTPKQAQLPNGTWVYRQNEIFVPELGQSIKQIDDDQHFIYEIPKKLVHLYPGPAYKCTCGGLGIYFGPSGYNWGASNQGLMFGCYIHMTTGQHATGGSQWV